MRIRLAFVILLLFGLLIDLSESKEIFDYKNLEGLQKVNEIMTVEIRVSGDEPFNLEETKIKDIIKKELREAKIQIDNANNSNATFVINIDGESTGGGGATFTIKLTLLSRVFSPFKQENKISAIIWSTEKHEEQVQSYDREKKKIITIRGKLNERVYLAVKEIMNKFQNDYKKANLK